MQRLVFHVGAHRAGSTTIQKPLVDHGKRLEEQDIAHVTRRTIRAAPELGPLLWMHLVPPAVVFPADYVRRACP